MSTETKPCPNCGGTGTVVLPTNRTAECATCDGTGIDIQHQLAVIVEDAQRGIVPTGPATSRAMELAQPDDPYLVPRWSSPQERLDEVNEHELAAAFNDMSRFPPPPPPDSTLRQREAIGRAIAEYMTTSRHGEHADMVAARIVAAVGPVEAFQLADVLGKWAGAIATRAEKAERMGLKR